MKKRSGTFLNNAITYAIVIAAFVVVQVLQSAGLMTRSMTGLLIPICAYIVMALSLNLTVGISGELSLGHAGFMSVGAFSGAVAAAYFLHIGVENSIVRLILCMFVGGIMAAAAGVVIGIPVLRLQGDYLAIVTLAFGEIIKNVMNCVYVALDGGKLLFSFNSPIVQSTESITAGNEFKMLINGPQGAVKVAKISTFAVGFALILFALFVILNLVNSRSGRAIMALRDNRIAAESVGISVTKFKLMAFVISASLAGMAGTLFALNMTTVQPSKFNFDTSILVLVFVVLGGIGSMRGSIIAAAVLTVLPEMLRSFSDYRMFVYAVILIAVMLLTNSQKVNQFIRKFKPAHKKEKQETGGNGHE